MAAPTDIWHSERGLIGIALIIAATVLAGISVISSEAWLAYTWKIFAIYAGAKTATGMVSAWKSKKDDAAIEEATP